MYKVSDDDSIISDHDPSTKFPRAYIIYIFFLTFYNYVMSLFLIDILNFSLMNIESCETKLLLQEKTKRKGVCFVS